MSPLIPSLLAAALAATGAHAQMSGHDTSAHAGHMAHMPATDMAAADPLLQEPGQGAFAALAEVVARLEADPATDWSTVNLTLLRDHLVDMDLVVSDTVATQEDLPDGIRVRVTGTGPALAAAGRMVPAHAQQLAQDPRWMVHSETAPDAVILQVTSDDPATVTRIKALGFYGLMASQDHHREHHWLIATTGAMHSGH